MVVFFSAPLMHVVICVCAYTLGHVLTLFDQQTQTCSKLLPPSLPCLYSAALLRRQHRRLRPRESLVLLVSIVRLFVYIYIYIYIYVYECTCDLVHAYVLGGVAC
jgi:hypothetical protein